MDPNHPNAKIIRDFYDSFARRDAEGMVTHYASDIHFSDAVFQNLHGDEACSMWRMLCERGKDLKIVASDIAADDTSGRAHWEADYLFSGTGRMVHNVIDARFTFRDGKIVRHVDTFNLHAWAGQALGLSGRLFGWLPPMQNAIRKKGDAGLRAFMRSQGSQGSQGSQNK